MPRSTPRPLLLVALLCLTVPACGSDSAVATTGDECRDGAPAGVGGEFEATLTGGQILQLCGFATSSEGPGGVGWAVQLVTPGGGASILMVTEQTGRPLPDTYDIVDFVATDATPGAEDYVVVVSLDGDVLGASGLSSVRGTLTIASSSAGRVSGTFDFSARDPLDIDRVVDIAGTFTADNEDA